MKSLLLLLTGCSLSVPIPEGRVDALAEEISGIGHPLGRYSSARVIGFSTGLLGGARSVDVAITYRPALHSQDKELQVRLLVDSIDPCKVRTEVLSDSGPAPLLLDNQIASPLVGGIVCEALE